ncbi:MAG: hypothetical protein ACRDGT_12445 [Candidatus Limnocylindria bacterium]
MNRLNLIASIAGTLALALTMIAAPATAQVTVEESAVFEGTADTPDGLWLPGIHEPPVPGGDWFFDAPNLALPAGEQGRCTDTRGGPGGCIIDAEGTLGASNGVGPYCGMSSGAGGGNSEPSSVTNSLGDVYTLTTIGWPATAGGTLPVSGTWTRPDGATGTLTAIVQAQGGAACATTGATTFRVVGEAELTR